LLDDQRKVLDMLAEGKISAGDAERLLKAMSGRPAATSSLADAIETETRERVEVLVETQLENRQPDSHEDTFAVGDSPKLVVSVDSGTLTVVEGPPGDVQVHATITDPSRVAYEANQEGDTVRISARKRSKKSLFGLFDFGQSGRADIQVTTPKTTDVEASFGTGPITLEGLDGTFSLDTATGRVTVEDASGTLVATAVTGRVKVDRFQGSAQLSTTTGKIDVKRSRGEFKAEVVTGGISFEGEMTPGGKNEMSTVTGGVSIQLDGPPSLNIDASCVTGRISSNLSGFASGGTVGSHLSGTMGKGEADLQVRTITGSVKIDQTVNPDGDESP
jgi:hypothetical protein